LLGASEVGSKEWRERERERGRERKRGDGEGWWWERDFKDANPSTGFPKLASSASACKMPHVLYSYGRSRAMDQRHAIKTFSKQKHFARNLGWNFETKRLNAKTIRQRNAGKDSS
jgi:hypothetical protein